MISISNLSLYFGGQDVFNKISLTVNKGDKIGLVGKNGAGKSTLLNLIDGDISPKDGEIAIPKGLNIGYLTQDLDFEDGFSVIDEAKKAFNEINLLQKEIDSLNQDMAKRTDYESDSYMTLISQLHENQEQFQIKGGNDLQSTISQVLEADFDYVDNVFSIGFHVSDLNLGLWL